MTHPLYTLVGMVDQVYRPRRPKASPCGNASKAFDRFLDAYEERYQPRYGFLRPIIPEVVNKFLDCGDLERGFARVRCDDCKHEYLLAFSCKGRWFCPSCHQKKVNSSGALLSETILFPVPHRFHLRNPQDAAPVLPLRPRPAQGPVPPGARVPARIPCATPRPARGAARHRHGDPHLRRVPGLPSPPPRLVADGLFARSGLFYCLPNVSIEPLEEMFRARVITFLVDKGLLPVERANMLRGWVHSGFNVHRSRRVLPDERGDIERLAQYIIRNPFAVEKMQVTEPNRAIRRSGYLPFRPQSEDTAQLRGLQSVRLHSGHHPAHPGQELPARSLLRLVFNKMRGQRDKHAAEEAAAAGRAVQTHRCLRTQTSPYPLGQVAELIKKVWEADPLLCPKCRKEMRIVSLINERDVIERILRHMGLGAGRAGLAGKGTA